MNSGAYAYTITYVIFFLFFVVSIVFVFIIKGNQKLFDNKLKNKELEIQYQEQVVAAIIASQEEERKRIAQDLHDDIGSKLIAASLNLHLLQSNKTSEADKPEIANNIRDIINRTMDISRTLAHHLLPPVLEQFGLDAALAELVHDYNKSNTVSIKYVSTIVFKTAFLTDQLQIFRIIQELISNSIKHGKATEIAILFNYTNSSKQCQYTDNGVGIDVQKLPESKKLGFFNIESRIKQLQGSYTLQSFPNKGMQFNFTFVL